MLPLMAMAASRNKELKDSISRRIKGLPHSLPKEKAPEGA
jgi:hypothetical protein